VLIEHHPRVAEDIRGSRLARLYGRALGERIGGFLYGTIVALAVIVAGARAYPDGSGHIAVLVAVTTGTFWLAHVYAHALAQSVGRDERLSLVELRQIARREASIAEAALPPVALLLLGSVGLISTEVAVWLALGVGLAVLVADGLAYARLERLSRLGTVVVVVTNLGLGLIIIGLKLLVIH
jgi:hypothetical protein